MGLFGEYLRRARNRVPNETADALTLDGVTLARLCCMKDADDVGDDLNLGIFIEFAGNAQAKEELHTGNTAPSSP